MKVSEFYQNKLERKFNLFRFFICIGHSSDSGMHYSYFRHHVPLIKPLINGYTHTHTKLTFFFHSLGEGEALVCDLSGSTSLSARRYLLARLSMVSSSEDLA